jgi:membrane associated rhomboid family serine protease
MFQTTSPPIIPRALKILLLVNVGLYVADYISQGFFTNLLALSTQHILSSVQIWRVISYVFIHDLNSIIHILFNMLMLWMFGMPVMAELGARKFLWLYFLAGGFAGSCSLLFDVVMGHPNVYIGSSGAVFAICVAFARFFPRQKIFLFFLFPVQAVWAVLIFIGIDLLLITSNDGIAHVTHLGGALFAFLFFRYENLAVQYWRTWKNRKFVKLSKEAEKASKSTEQTIADIDPILEKISRKGMSSLTDQEKKTLESASKAKKHQRKKIIKFEEYRREKP